MKTLFYLTLTLLFKKSLLDVLYYRCPDGTVRHENSCYIFGHEIGSWPDAIVYCQAFNAHLAFIESASEQAFIASQIRILLGSQTDTFHYYWLGGTDGVSQGHWFWAGTGQQFQYTNWKPGEPNDDHTHEARHQDCLAIYSETGLWDDGHCKELHNFICEIELSQEPIVGK